MLYIKLKGMEHRAPFKYIFCPYTHTHSNPRWDQKVKTFFFPESSHVAYQIKGNGTYSTMQAHIMSLLIHSVPVVESKHSLSVTPNID